MNILKTSLLALTILLNGCATTDHIYDSKGGCLTCFNNPFTGEAVNHDNSTKNAEIADVVDVKETENKQTNESVSYSMHQVKVISSKNVDVAFIKIKNDFQFQSEAEVRKEMGSYAEFKLRSLDYKWSALPSVFYKMGSARDVIGSRMNIEVVINKVTDSSSEIIAKFWPRDDSVNTNEVGKYLSARINNALNN